MIRKSARVVGVVLAISLLGSIFTACGTKKTAPEATQTQTTVAPEATQPESTVPEEFVKVNTIMPGDPTNRMTDFLQNEFKEKMKTELNMELEVNFIPWDQYWSKIDMMTAAAEPLDWFWNGFSTLQNMVAKKQIMSISDILKANGQDILKVIPEKNFKATAIGGQIYAIPTSYGPSAEKFSNVLVRQDMLEEAGMTEIKSSTDLEAYADKVVALHSDMHPVANSADMALLREFSDKPVVATGPQNSLIIGQDDNKVYSYFESDAFKKISQFNRKMFLKKYVTEDVTIKSGEYMARMESGKYLWSLGAITRPMENIQALNKNVPTGKLAEYLLSPEKPKYITSPGNEIMVITSYSKNAERAMMFLNWIYKSQDNYNFLLYGVKDKDYKITNDRVEALTTDTLFYEWMFRNTNYMLYPSYVSDSFIESFKKRDEDALYSNNFGFVFDSSSVVSEEGKISSLVIEKFIPLATGFMDYDKYYVSAQKSLKDAGIDKYIAEYQKQLDAFIASQK